MAFSAAYCVIRLLRIREYHIENKLFCCNHNLFTLSVLQKILLPKQMLSNLIAIIQEIVDRDLLGSISIYRQALSSSSLIFPSPPEKGLLLSFCVSPGQSSLPQPVFICAFLWASIDDGCLFDRIAHCPIDQPVFLKVGDFHSVKTSFIPEAPDMLNHLDKKLLVHPVSDATSAS